MIALTRVVVDALHEIGLAPESWTDWADVEMEYLVAHPGCVYVDVLCAFVMDERPYCPTCGKRWDPRRKRALRQVI